MVIADDLEGPNEASVELLVLGKLTLLYLKDFSCEILKSSQRDSDTLGPMLDQFVQY